MPSTNITILQTVAFGLGDLKGSFGFALFSVLILIMMGKVPAVLF